MRLRRPHFLFAALCAATVVTACSDDIPTASGEDAFPPQGRASTFDVLLSADSLTVEVGRFSDYTGPGDAAYLIVADDFGGVLDAHALVRFTDAPQSVQFSSGGTTFIDTAFVYAPGNLIARVDTSASAAAGTVLQLWAVGQEWSPANTTWERATDSTLWQEPGGTRAELLSEASATPSAGDSVLLPLDSAQVARIADPDFPGLLLTARGAPGRVRLTLAGLATALRPASRTDTTIAQTLMQGPRTFIFTPEPPRSVGAWEAGGIRSARTLFRLRIPDRISACGDPPPTSCGTVALEDVTVNSASLLFTPVPVPGGFGPLGTTTLSLRSVFEPGLGRAAPLGPLVTDQRFVGAATVFAQGRLAPGDTVVAIPIGQYLQSVARADSTAVTLALLGEPEAASFGVAWFQPAARLRIVYTLPSRTPLP